MIIQAIPSSGKSTLLRKFAKPEGLVCNTDEVMRSLGFLGNFDKLLLDPVSTQKFFDAVRKADEMGYVLTNLNLAKFKLRVDIRFCYEPELYVTHVRDSDRTDLIDTFGSDTLESWAQDYRKHNNVVWMRPGQYIDQFLTPMIVASTFATRGQQ